MPLAFIWSEFAQQVTGGLAAGAIYASLALALVLIYQTTNVVNFAQGEMATFTTYVAWSLMHHGLGYWPAFVLTLLIAFGGGVAVERVLIRPVEHRPEIVIVILTIGMFIAINGLVGWIFGPEVKAFDSPFPIARSSSAASQSPSRTSAPSVSVWARSSRSGSSFGSRLSGSRCARSRSTRARAG